MSFLKHFQTPLLKNTGSTARDHLASERTFLAWIRTGLGFIALGIAVERFSQLDLDSLIKELRPSTTDASTGKFENDDDNIAKSKEQALVGGLLGTGSGSIVYGTTRYFSNLRLIEQGNFKPAFHGAAVLSVAVAGMAGAAYWNTMRHGRKKEREAEEKKKKRMSQGHRR